MYKLHTQCRACGYASPGPQGVKASSAEKLIEVFDLGVQPLSNDFRRAGEAHAGYAPLKVLFCPRCSLAQLSVAVQPEILYSNYSYVTSPSAMMKAHFDLLIKDIKAETDGHSVLEIGSNDGRLLAQMRDDGLIVAGVDPADNLAGLARQKGIQTQSGFFGESLSRLLPKFDIVIARHVFCHCDDWHDFVRGLENVVHPETIICIEAPYAADTLKQCEFDQVYHEHLSYLSLKPLEYLLKDTRLKLHRVTHYPIHGGAILAMLRHRDSERKSSVIPSESITADSWHKFGVCARDQMNRLTASVKTLRVQGKTVAALGASAKSTVWINACGFSRKDISFIADNTPQKQLTCSPGSEIPIVDEGAILRELPDYVVMFAWNYRDEILKKFELARSKGVKFIIPHETIEVV